MVGFKLQSSYDHSFGAVLRRWGSSDSHRRPSPWKIRRVSQPNAHAARPLKLGFGHDNTIISKTDIRFGLFRATSLIRELLGVF
jgi:hypothetical protein